MGTLPTWWNAEDGRIGGPLIDESQWHRQLDSQFGGTDFIIKDKDDSRGHGASVMVTTKSAPPKDLPFSEIMLLIPDHLSSDSSRMINALREDLQALGLEVLEATLEQATILDIGGTIPVSCKAVISLLEIENPLIFAMEETEFEKLHAVLLKGMGGLWVTHATSQVDPSSQPQYCATTGLLRTLRTEKPEIRMHQLDLSTETMVSHAHVAGLISRVFQTEFQADFLLAETEVAERNERLLIPRLYDDKDKNHSLHMQGRKSVPELQHFVQPGRPLRLEVGVPGMLDSLHFVDDPRPFAPLGEHEIEFSVQASAVNFM